MHGELAFWPNMMDRDLGMKKRLMNEVNNIYIVLVKLELPCTGAKKAFTASKFDFNLKIQDDRC